MTLRVMTYNIRTGAVDADGTDRLPAVTAVVDRVRPDLLAVQELRRFGPRRLTAFAAAVGMTPVLAPALVGQPVAVFVRPPGRIIRSARLRWRLHHAAAVAVVDTDQGPLTMVSTHLHPLLPGRRSREARRLARRFGRVPPAIVAGDLNGLDPWTPHTERVAALGPAYRSRHLRPDGTVDTRAVAAFAAAGFVDAWRLAGTGSGRTAPTTAGGGAEFSGMRLDYVLATGAAAARVRSCRVVRGDESEYASDHYPVVAELDLSFR